ncbi:HlyD family secretion protein [Acidiphilium iwatense]|uniref:HlyD family secretion protein n=2 Tax=Acidiphilium iwatense TaxID=768198 RepID=A0ABS9DV30_9PROT|nr:HlyD family secretion protein [Acidiphilium sp. AL]MCF3946588.1 HlyD family secretion protein [Acidiphilium iwatense]
MMDDDGRRNRDLAMGEDDRNESGARQSRVPNDAVAAITPPRSKRPFVVLAIVLLALVVAGIVYWLHARQFATTTDAEIDGAIHRIAPRISGQVEAVLVHQNQHVAKGQLLVRLNAGTEIVALDRARAQRAQAVADVGTRNADVAQAEANVAVARANLFKAQRDAARYARVNPQAVTRTALDAATADLRATEARLDAAKQQVTGAEAGLVAAKAALKATDVAVENAKLQLSYTSIRAPASGYIAERSVRTGNVVAAGSGLMALVGDRLWVTANYKETELGHIHPGQHVRVYIDAVPGVAFHARVASIQRGTGSVFSLLPAQNATGNYVKIVQRVPVRIIFDDHRIGKYLLAPGMSAEPFIRIASK